MMETTVTRLAVCECFDLDIDLDEIFQRIRRHPTDDQYRLFAHIEDRVREQIDKLKGETDD